MSAQIRIPATDGSPGSLELDGVRLRGVTGFTLVHDSPQSVPRLTVDLSVCEIDYVGDVKLFVADRAVDLLIRHGWTQPTDSTDA